MLLFEKWEVGIQTAITIAGSSVKLDSLKEGFGFTELFLVRRSLQTGFGDILACLLVKFPGYLSHDHLVRRFQTFCSGGLGLSTLWNRQQRRRYSSSTENKKPTVLLGKKYTWYFLKQYLMFYPRKSFFQGRPTITNQRYHICFVGRYEATLFFWGILLHPMVQCEAPQL